MKHRKNRIVCMLAIAALTISMLAPTTETHAALRLDTHEVAFCENTMESMIVRVAERRFNALAKYAPDKVSTIKVAEENAAVEPTTQAAVEETKTAPVAPKTAANQTAPAAPANQTAGRTTDTVKPAAKPAVTAPAAKTAPKKSAAVEMEATTEPETKAVEPKAAEVKTPATSKPAESKPTEHKTTPTKTADTKAPAKEPETNAPAKESETKAPAKEAETKAPAKEAETKAPAKEPETKAPAKEPETKAPAKEPETKAPEKKAEVKKTETKKEASAHQHHFVKVVTKEPGCKTSGTYVMKCECGVTNGSGRIDPLGHDIKVIKTTAGNCKERGTVIEQCTRCSQKWTKRTEYGDHHYAETSESGIPLCQRKGYSVKCTICGKVKRSVSASNVDHSYTVPGEITEATCEHAGTQKFECEYGCGKFIEKTIAPKLAHDMKVTEKKDATCTENGYIERTCSICGKTETETIPAKGHVRVTKVIKKSTCTEEGLAEIRCSVCNELLETTALKVDPNAHEWVLDKDRRLEKCEHCGKTYEDAYN